MRKPPNRREVTCHIKLTLCCLCHAPTLVLGAYVSECEHVCMRVCVHICFVLHTEKTSRTQTREYPLFLSLSLSHTYTQMHTNGNFKWIRNPIKKNKSEVLRTLHRCSVGHSKGLLIPRSSVRFRQKPENSNSHGFELHGPSIKGTKLLLKVIKAIIIITRRRKNFWVFCKHSVIDHVHFMKWSVLTHTKRISTLITTYQESDLPYSMKVDVCTKIQK